jgi:hypothetical protein
MGFTGDVAKEMQAVRFVKHIAKIRDCLFL